jgi:hypothetical protein
MAHFLPIPNGFFDASGALVSGRVGFMVKQVAGPVNYAGGGGIAVDVSGTFSRVLTASLMRQFQTAAPASPPGSFLSCTVVEDAASGNTFANGKFKLAWARISGYTPAGTVAAPVFAGTPLANFTPAGMVAAPVFTGTPLANFTPAGMVAAPTLNFANGAVTDPLITPSLAASVLGNHGNGALVGVTGVQAPAFTGTPASPGTPAGSNSAPAFTGTPASPGTPAGSNSAPAFTGTAVSLAPTDGSGSATNGNTYEVLVMGVLL